MAAYRRVCYSRHLQADCQEPVSAPEPYARQSSMGYLCLCFVQLCWPLGVLYLTIGVFMWGRSLVSWIYLPASSFFYSILRRNTSYGSVYVCLSQSVTRCSVETDGQIELAFDTKVLFDLSSSCSHPVIRKFGYLQQCSYFRLELCPKLWPKKISPRQVDHVLDKTHRRSSLLITRRSTRRG